MDFTATVAGSTDSAAPRGGRMWSVGAGPPYWRGLFGGPRSARPWAAGIGHMFLDDGKGGVWGLSRAVWRAGAGGGRGPTRGAPTGGPQRVEGAARRGLLDGRSGHRHRSPRAPHPRQGRHPRGPKAGMSAGAAFQSRQTYHSPTAQRYAKAHRRHDGVCYVVVSTECWRAAHPDQEELGGNILVEPLHALALSMQSNPGVYALLLGSGVSRAARIPTGWEITLDLVRKLADLEGATSISDLESWYVATYGKEPNYSDLLDTIAKKPTERQQLLRSYWETTDGERDDGAKQPTLAHKAIAQLVSKGFVRVIITTNFDRLIEDALDDAGVEATVLSSLDQLQGAVPLIHMKCCVFKIHGDYRDPRILNTSGELDTYPEEFDRFLDRVFDEFGLIVCGWSAEWDAALRRALSRAPARRYTTYWTVHGELDDQAKRLVQHRKAEQIAIKDADTFFQELERMVGSIAGANSGAVATEDPIGRLKRYLAKPEHRIDYSDLINEVADGAYKLTQNDEFIGQGMLAPTPQLISERVSAYDTAYTTLLEMAIVGGFWADDHHFNVWERALRRLSPRPSSGYTTWITLHQYPSLLLLYALGLGAVEANRLRFLNQLLRVTAGLEHGEPIRMVELPGFFMSIGLARHLEGMERHRLPLSGWLRGVLRQHARHISLDDEQYTAAFDKLEILIALNYSDSIQRDWVPFGEFVFRGSSTNRIFTEIQDSILNLRTASPYVAHGLFGVTPEACKANLAKVQEFIKGLGPTYGVFPWD